MAFYNHKEVEARWQKRWEEEQAFVARDGAPSSPEPTPAFGHPSHVLMGGDDSNVYVLDMFPYPSADGLHVGHPKGYTATDILSRYLRMTGKNVLHPMGWDAFGLPAENYAIKKGVHPAVVTAKNIANFKRQIQSLGFSYDWSREVNTTDPKYYKWTQWIFLQLFKRGLAYEKEAPIWWCPKDKTGLANEEVVNGKCERCGTVVEKKMLKQWMLKITAYAERLISGLVNLDWPEGIKTLQRNWIGRSEGAEVEFEVEFRGGESGRELGSEGVRGEGRKELGSRNNELRIKNEEGAVGERQIKKKILIGTRNSAKIEMIEKAFKGISDFEFVSLNDLVPIDDSELIEGNDFLENAKRKSEFYFQKTGIPTISTDHILWIEKWPENDGVVLHIRKLANPKSDRATDEEVIAWYQKFLKGVGGSSRTRFDYAVAYTDNFGTSVYQSPGNESILQPEQASHFPQGYATEALLKDPETGEFRVDQSEDLQHKSTFELLRSKVLDQIIGKRTVKVFTTRPDTLFGATYLVLAPEHELVDVITTKEQKLAVISYQKEVASKSDLERTALEKEKTGVFTGGYATNPATGQKIPIWIADYVLALYGTGAIMAVPGHDERDFSFAKKFGLPIVPVIKPSSVMSDREKLFVPPVMSAGLRGRLGSELEPEPINAVVIHGCPVDEEKAMSPADRTYDKHWIPWIKNQLDATGIKTETPLMPEPWRAVYQDWKEELEKSSIDENTVLIGTSCGTAFLVRWLGETKRRVRALILVAPWKIPDVENIYPEKRQDFYDFAIDPSIKDRVREIIIFTSDNEVADGKKSSEMYREKLEARVIELPGRGHYVQEHMGTIEFPELLDVVKGLKGFCYVGEGTMINSGQFDGMSSEEGRKKIVEWLSQSDTNNKPSCLIVHGISGHKRENWFPWLKQELDTKGWDTKVPTMPGAGHPTAKSWDGYLKQYDESLDERSVLIGHSLGCAAVLQHLQELNHKVDTIILVAPTNPLQNWFALKRDYPTADWNAVERMNRDKDFDWGKIRKLARRFVIIHSDNDPFIPSESISYFKKNLPTAEFLCFPGKQHLSENWGGVTELPEILQFIPQLSESRSKARFAVQYKLRDWVFSRQRYWGEPIPLVHCEKDGVVPLPEDQLPLLLPNVEKYEPTGTGESPLAGIKNWVNTTCPQCGGPARRETNTMPQWAGSCWYYLRYLDPKNEQRLADPEKMKAWLPVDTYVGGAEHAVLHLLYARFWHKVLFDAGVIPEECGDEPFLKLRNVGLILGEDGEKMSKSRGNVINPDEIVEKFGADSFRLYEMFMGPFEDAMPWQTNSVLGVRRFLERVNTASQRVSGQAEMSRIGHQTVAAVTKGVQEFRFNTCVSDLMKWSNSWKEGQEISRTEFGTFLKVLAPFAPHLAEELWSKLGHETLISLESWPAFDQKMVTAETVTIAVQVMGKLRATVTMPAGSSQDTVEAAVKAEPNVMKYLTKDPKKVIFVKDKLINFVI